MPRFAPKADQIGGARRFMKSQEDLSAPYYAVWIGNMEPDALQLFYDDGFSQKFGFAIGAFGPESKSGTYQAIEDLFEGFGYKADQENFVRSAVAAATEIGISHASCAVVFYNLHYDESLGASNAVHEEGLMFLCNIPRNLPEKVTVPEKGTADL